jgi:hypothetical protein
MDKLLENIKNNSELFIAVLSLIVAITSMIFGVVSLVIQRSHNKKSVLPLGVISLANYENDLRIKIKNNGVGPLIIQEIKTYKNGNFKNYPIDWFENENIIWKTFQKNLENYSIPANSESILLEYNVDLSDQKSVNTRELIRNILKDLTIKVKYKDIYDKSFNIERNLSWFNGNK